MDLWDWASLVGLGKGQFPEAHALPSLIAGAMNSILDLHYSPIAFAAGLRV